MKIGPERPFVLPRPLVATIDGQCYVLCAFWLEGERLHGTGYLCLSGDLEGGPIQPWKGTLPLTDPRFSTLRDQLLTMANTQAVLDRPFVASRLGIVFHCPKCGRQCAKSRGVVDGERPGRFVTISCPKPSGCGYVASVKIDNP